MGILGTLCVILNEKACGCCPCYRGSKVKFPWTNRQLMESDYLEMVLKEQKAIPASALITSKTSKAFAIGEGLMSRMYRFELTYVDDPAAVKNLLGKKTNGESKSAPEEKKLSVICKLPPEFAKPRLLGMLFKLFSAEVQFYDRSLATNAGLSMPYSYCAKSGPHGRYLIVMEDLAPAKCENQIVGITPEKAKIALSAISKLHAKFYGKTRSSEDTKDWLLHVDDHDYNAIMKKEYNKRVVRTKFFKNLAAVKMEKAMTPYLYECLEMFGRNFDNCVKLFAQLGAEGDSGNSTFSSSLTVTHTDLRCENMFFNAPGVDGRPFKLIDFQVVREGPPEIDISYFLHNSLPIALRQKHEQELLLHYHAEMVKNGAKGYRLVDLLVNYVFCTYANFLILVIGVGDTDTNSERAKELMRVWVERTAAFVADSQFQKVFSAVMALYDESSGKYQPITESNAKEMLPKHLAELIGKEGEGRAASEEKVEVAAVAAATAEEGDKESTK